MYVLSRHTKVGRSIWESVKEGKIVINAHPDHDKNAAYYTAPEKGSMRRLQKYEKNRTEYIIKNEDVAEVIRYYKEDNKPCKSHVIYGVGMKRWCNGKLVEEERYKAGTNQARIWKGVWETEQSMLGDQPVTITKKCYGGGFRKEVVIYGHKKSPKVTKNNVAYQVSYGQKAVRCVYPGNKPWLNLVCFADDRIKFAYKESILCGEEGASHWRNRKGNPKAKDYNYNEYTQSGNYEVELFTPDGKIECKGRSENRQKVGIWIEDFKQVWYLSGVSVTEKLFNAKPEDIDPQDVLQIENVQLRTSLMKKVGTEKFLQKCNAVLVDKDGDNELYELPMKGTRTERDRWSREPDAKLILLKVKDPSTGTFYTLRVPPDSKKCEEARKWTLGFNQADGEKMEFVNET